MIIFDTETTNLIKAIAINDKHQPRMIEFAGIKLNDETLEEEERMSFFVNPLVPVPDFITKITNITTAMVSKAPPFSKRVEKLRGFFLGEKTLIAHNLSFDLGILELELKRIGVEDFPVPPNLQCTVEQSLHLENKRLNQATLYSYATGGKTFEGAHRAINDVEALAVCVKWMIGEGMIEL